MNSRYLFPESDYKPEPISYHISGNIDSDFDSADRFSIVKLKFTITCNLPLAI